MKIEGVIFTCDRCKKTEIINRQTGVRSITEANVPKGWREIGGVHFCRRCGEAFDTFMFFPEGASHE